MKKKIKAILTNLAKKNLFFRKISRGVLNTYKHIRYKFRGIDKKIDENMVFSVVLMENIILTVQKLYTYI